MFPNDNSDASINVWCDWLTDNGQEQLADEIRFEEFSNHLGSPFFNSEVGDRKKTSEFLTGYRSVGGGDEYVGCDKKEVGAIEEYDWPWWSGNI